MKRWRREKGREKAVKGVVGEEGVERGGKGKWKGEDEVVGEDKGRENV